MSADWVSVCTPGGTRNGNDARPVYAAVAAGSVYVYDPNIPNPGWVEVPESGTGLQTWGEPVQVEIAGVADGTYRLVALGLDGRLYYFDRTLIPGTTRPAGWTQVPGLPAPFRVQALAVTGMPDGSVQLVSKCPGNPLYTVRWKADGTWGPWTAAPGAPADIWYLSAAAMPDGSTQMCAICDHDVYHAILAADGTWSPWNPVGGANAPDFEAPISITTTADGQAQLVGICNGAVMHRVRYPNREWQASWQPVPGIPQGQYESSACISACADGSAVVVARARGQAQQVANDVRQFCGVWNLPDIPHSTPQGDVGCVYLNANGDVLTGYLSRNTYPGFSSRQFESFPVVGLQFDQATSWQDADGMLHVYASAGGDLRVVHQNGWQRYSYQSFDRLMPTWVKAAAVKVVGDQSIPVGFSTTVAVGLRSDVLGFWLDAYPDYKPSELVQSAEKRAEEAFSILTQDVTSTTWVDDSVRLPDTAAGDPYIVSRYVAEATLLDTLGTPLPGHPVTITAQELAQVYLHGVSYLVGPGKTVTVDTDYSGKLTVSVDADNLTPPKVVLNSDGLATGTVIDFGADVNNYLAGSGTLPSQASAFTPDALKNAEVADNGTGAKAKLVPDGRWTKDLQPDTVVTHCRQIYGMAGGSTPEAFTMMFEGFDSPQPVVGYVFQNWDPDRPRFQAFRTVDELEDYRAYRDGHPAYGGFWDDFLHWAGDVWEGIKTAATKIAEVVVDIANKVVDIAIAIGDAIVSLGKMIINAVEQAARAVEAVFQMIADAVVRVVEWLKSLFAFKDIWDTKTALESMVTAYLPWLSTQITRFQGLAHGWFGQQEDAVDTYFESLKAQFGDTRIGDTRNKVPAGRDAAGAPMDSDALQANPQANWMMNQIGVQAAASAGAVSFEFVSDPIADAFDAFINNLTTSGAVTNFSRACDSVADAVEALLTGDKSPIVPLLDAFQSIAKAVLQALDAITGAVLTFSAAALTELQTFLFAPQPGLGLVNLVYRWIQKQANVPAADIKDASIGGLFLLVAGFLGTVAYKLAMGVDNPPFPGGVAPSVLTADGAAGGELVQGSQAANTGKMIANACLNIPCAFLSAGANLLTDIGIDEHATYGKVVQGFGIVTCIIGAVTYFPLLTGDDASTSEIVQCVGWGLYALLNVGAAIPFKGRNGCAFKNLMNRTMGPVATTIIGFGLLGVSIWDCLDSDADPMTWSSDVFGCTSMTFQFLRCARVWWLDAAVTGLDAASNLITYLIPGIEALCELGGQPQIGPFGDGGLTLTAGTVGMTYSFPLTATSYYIGTGYGQADNWVLVGSGALPTGLTLDIDQGTVSGTPTATGNSQTFAVQCCDTFGPPGYSSPTTLTMSVGPTKATTLALGAASARIQVGTVAANLLTATVSGASGALAGYTVRFTAAPTSGASVSFLEDTSNAGITAASNTIDVTTDAKGIATVPYCWANGTSGQYSVQVQVPGVPQTLQTVSMTNLPANNATVTPVALSTPQAVSILASPKGTAYFRSAGDFPYPLSAKVADAAGNPMANVVVTFAAPPDTSTARYGVFANSGATSNSVVTDASGLANAGTFSGATIYLGFAEIVPFTVTATTDFGPHTSFALQYDAK